jgi:hypothetical protein
MKEKENAIRYRVGKEKVNSTEIIQGLCEWCPLKSEGKHFQAQLFLTSDNTKSGLT